MNITCLCGPSGAGKTHYYRNNLSNQKMFDIADVYRDYPGIDYQDAFAELLNRIQIHISDTGTTPLLVKLSRNCYASMSLAATGWHQANVCSGAVY